MYCKAPKSKEFIAIRAIIHRRLYKLSSDALVTKFIKVFRVCMAHCLTCKKERANALFYPCKDLVIVGRARREYWKNGEKVISSELSNVYFHVNPNCVAVKNAFFVPGLVQIPPDLQPFLKESHKRELKRKLNLNFS